MYKKKNNFCIILKNRKNLSINQYYEIKFILILNIIFIPSTHSENVIIMSIVLQIYKKNVRNDFTSREIKSDKSLNVFAFFNPQMYLILLYGGSPLSLPL